MTKWTEGVYKDGNFPLDKGGSLPEVELAYIYTGELSPDGRNAILVTHGYTTGHHFVQPDSLAAEGSWNGLVGAGKPIDTEKFFVISSNALGSCYGSTGPASINPANGQIYGESFPRVTFADTVMLQHRLLNSLGVKHLYAVAGPSMGGFQALQWGIQFPDFVDRLVLAVSGLEAPARREDERQTLARQIRMLPEWNNGNPADEAMVPWLIQLRMGALRAYSMDVYLHEQGMPISDVEEHLLNLATLWARNFYPWSLVTLAQAMDDFNSHDKLHAIKAKLLLALCENDQIFPSSNGAKAIEQLHSAGVDAEYFEIPSRFGHLASGIDWKQWETALRNFLK